MRPGLTTVTLDLGDLERAHACYERELRIREARLPASHPAIAASRVRLAEIDALLRTQALAEWEHWRE